ncbi:MAG: serine/threonine-protein phosphatase [candidate division Zixibacteria bacterium]|nr:serine/threonine-protein phosphatase [candidate division Zixibacteria bacterium]
MQAKTLYSILSRGARFTLLAAIFFIFSPISLLAVSNIGKGWLWTDVAGWMIGSSLIAVCWAWAAFKGKYFWVPIAANILIPAAQGMVFSKSMQFGNAGATVTGVLVVVSIALGYVLFVIFIRGEGAKTLHLQTEMTLAKEIHDHLVPDVAYEDAHWEILGSSAASTEVGGDLLDLSQRNGAMLVTVADVSGHGVRAGVMMAMIKSALKTSLLRGDRHSVCSDLNEVVYSLKRPDMYATGVHLDLRPDRQVRYTGAGHPSLLHIRADGTCFAHESQNPPMGVLPGMAFTSADITLQTSDLLVILTDGLIEIGNKQGEQFGMDRIERHFRANASKPLLEIRASLIKEVLSFGAQEDDQTIVLIRAK